MAWSSRQLGESVLDGVASGLGFFQNGTRQYLGVKPESNVMDGSGEGGFYFLLWGEPGLRWFWGVVLFFGCFLSKK
jgi:hypothetical protein